MSASRFAVGGPILILATLVIAVISIVRAEPIAPQGSPQPRPGLVKRVEALEGYGRTTNWRAFSAGTLATSWDGAAAAKLVRSDGRVRQVGEDVELVVRVVPQVPATTLETALGRLARLTVLIPDAIIPVVDPVEIGRKDASLGEFVGSVDVTRSAGPSPAGRVEIVQDWHIDGDRLTYPGWRLVPYIFYAQPAHPKHQIGPVTHGSVAVWDFLKYEGKGAAANNGAAVPKGDEGMRGNDYCFEFHVKFRAAVDELKLAKLFAPAATGR